MLKLGIIGTNWITHAFVEAAIESNAYQLKAVYSRKSEKAIEFRSHYENASEIGIATDLHAFCQSKEIEVIYIASPNSLHYEQAKVALENGKHVIVEKPAVSTFSELKELLKLAKEKKRFYFEAARHIHEDNFKKVTEIIQQHKTILGADLTFMKYSSRYDAVLNGETPNIFSPKFSGGALMDLGIYLVYAAVSWFGVPKETHYFYQKLPTGVDGMGTLVFRYNSFDVTMLVGKNADSYLPSEIYFSDETLSLDAINSITEITLKKRKGEELVIEKSESQLENPMLKEAIAFSEVINHPNNQEQQKLYDAWTTLSLEVHQMMTSIRQKAGIVFAADA